MTTFTLQEAANIAKKYQELIDFVSEHKDKLNPPSDWMRNKGTCSQIFIEDDQIVCQWDAYYCGDHDQEHTYTSIETFFERMGK